MTQNNTGIPISFSHNLAPIRLIELPPALLSLLTNNNSDSPRPTFHIKASSSPTSDSSSSSSAQTPTNHAVLTTPTQTYSLRQVYSSNSILLLQPTTTNNTNLTVVSTANSYMELIPTTHDATTLILEHVPVFPPPDSVTPVTRTSLLSSLPVSPAEFDAAWTNLCCFDCPGGFAYRPLPSTILETLKAITLINYHDFDDGVDLGKFLPEDIVEAIDRYYAAAHGQGDVDEDEDEDEQDEEPRRCVPGLVKSILAEISMCGSRGLGGDYRAIFDDKLMEWVGRLVLEDWALKVKGDMLYASFMRKWRQELPEWLSSVDCELKLIEGWYTLPTPSTIRFVPGGKAAPVEADAKPQKWNKWHERLGKGKRR